MDSYTQWMLEREPFNFGHFSWPEDVPFRVSILDLHPGCRGAFALLQVRLLEAWEQGTIKNRFLMFEGYRPPERQDQLYAQGRTKAGAKVTNAQGWQSAHQHCLGVDFVPNDPGKGWHWSEDADWNSLQHFSHQRGLMNTLRWDRPHVWHPYHDQLVARLRR